jgi:hypothetical protein
MNKFSDDDLTQAFRKANRSIGNNRSGLSREGNEEFDREMEALESNYFGLVGRRLYRELKKHWPKPEENYDWVYLGKAADCTPIENLSVSENNAKYKKYELIKKHEHNFGVRGVEYLETYQRASYPLIVGFSPKDEIDGVSPASNFISTSDEVPEGGRTFNLRKHLFKRLFIDNYEARHRPESLAFNESNPESIDGRRVLSPASYAVDLEKQFLAMRESHKVFLQRARYREILDRHVVLTQFNGDCLVERRREAVDLKVILIALNLVVHELNDKMTNKSRSRLSIFSAVASYVKRVVNTKVVWHAFPSAAHPETLTAKIGGDVDYFFNASSQALSLSRSTVANNSDLEVIFDVSYRSPDIAGLQIVKALRTLHLEHEGLKVIEPLKEVVRRQADVL